MSSIAERLRQHGEELPSVPAAVGRFEHGVRSGNLLFLSGQGPLLENGSLAVGKVGADFTTEQGYYHARRTGLVLLAVTQQCLGSLERIERVVKLFGMVNAVPEFDAHPQVINGCSDLFIEVLGERGHHARSAVGMGSLPGGISVEIEAILQIRADSELP